MSKDKKISKTIFFSYIHEEKELAKLLKNEIKKRFQGFIEVFLSSNPETIMLGDKWLDKINKGLNEAIIMLIFCSSKSIERLWINFECGAGWQKNIKVIPVCYAGIDKAQLPCPLNELQGFNIAEKGQLENLFQLIIDVIKKEFPKFPFLQSGNVDELYNQLVAWEKEYTTNEGLKQPLLAIQKIDSEFIEILQNCIIRRTRKGYKGCLYKNYPHTIYTKIEKYIDELKNGDFLRFTLKEGCMLLDGSIRSGQQIDFEYCMTEKALLFLKDYDYSLTNFLMA